MYAFAIPVELKRPTEIYIADRLERVINTSLIIKAEGNFSGGLCACIYCVCC